MRNYDALLGNISRWLKATAKMFVHHLCHRSLMYPFETQGDDNWMGAISSPAPDASRTRGCISSSGWP